MSYSPDMWRYMRPTKDCLKDGVNKMPISDLIILK
jgi:hypothetical protein